MRQTTGFTTFRSSNLYTITLLVNLCKCRLSQLPILQSVKILKRHDHRFSFIGIDPVRIRSKPQLFPNIGPQDLDLNRHDASL